ncbi:amidohydrolase family protein [Parvibaculum sp.]|jgi:hypothetical protein|uniref:amidohydrolase family protein n=2 Tax=Parvibaculum sp. TaxID=2024848 RepID=UPI002FDA33C4
MKMLLKWTGGILAGIAAAVLLLWWAVLPPRLNAVAQQDLILSGVTVVNPGTKRLTGQTIVIRQGRIEAIRPIAANDPEPICEGCFAMPGLIDAHVHTPPSFIAGNQRLFALMYLRYGVTSVRDVGQSEAGIADFAAALNAGAIAGPHMYRCGEVLEGSPPGWPVARIVETAGAARAAVMELADAGVDCVKVYNEINRESFEAVAEAAAERHLPLIGHVPHAVGLADVKDFEVQHFTGIPYVSASRPPLGWDYRDEDVAAMSGDDIQRAVGIAAANRLSMTPTLANHTLRLTDSDRQQFPPSAGAAHLPAFWADSWQLVAGHPRGSEVIHRRLATQQQYDEIVRQMNSAGVDVLAGTDTLMPWVVPGESMHLELARLEVVLGSAEAALRAATAVNGRHIAPGDVGEIREGMHADILLLPEDPAASLEVIDNWRMLIADGRLYDRQTIDAWLSRYDKHFHGAIYNTVISGLVSALAQRFAHGHADD